MFSTLLLYTYFRQRLREPLILLLPRLCYLSAIHVQDVLRNIGLSIPAQTRSEEEMWRRAEGRGAKGDFEQTSYLPLIPFPRSVSRGYGSMTSLLRVGG